MSDEAGENKWLKRNLSLTIGGIVAFLLIVSLSSLLVLREEIAGKSPEFVNDVIHATTAALKDGGDIDKAKLSLEIVDHFAHAFESMRMHTFLYELGVHLAIAGLVAIILLISVEWQVRKFNQKELEEFRKVVAADVWQAVSNKLVPKEVTHQIKAILQSDFVKKNAHYSITLDELPGSFCGVGAGEEDQWILLKRELLFTVENISGSDAVYEFFSKILTTADKCSAINIKSDTHGFKLGETVHFPRHEFFSVGGDNQRINDQNASVIERNISIGAYKSIEISHAVCEILRVNDEVYYVQNRPLIGLEVMVTNLIPQRISIDDDIYLSHPEKAHFLKKPTHGHAQRRIFEGSAILPGQMFSVHWKKVEITSPPPGAEAKTDPDNLPASNS